jgi:hypothetical protein
MLSVRSKTIDLPSPILNDGRPVSSIVLSPPTIGARRQAEGFLRNGQQGEAASKFQIALVGKCSGLPDATIEQMDMDAFNEAWSFVSGFLLYAPETTLPQP